MADVLLRTTLTRDLCAKRGSASHMCKYPACQCNHIIYQGQLDGLIDAALAALQAAGMVMMPVEASNTMIIAAKHATGASPDQLATDDAWADEMRIQWRAMLAASGAAAAAPEAGRKPTSRGKP